MGQALLLLFVFTVLVACKPGGPNPTPSNEGKNSINNPWWTTTGELEKDSDGNVIFNDVEIALTTVVAGEDLAPFQELVAGFNAEYSGEIYITVTSLNQLGYEQTVTDQIINNSNAPDLIMSHQKGHSAFAGNKVIQPFDEAMEKSGIVLSMNDYSASLGQYASLGYEGYTFGVPIDAQSEVVYYNKQLLDKYSDDGLPSNREELLKICKKVKDGEGITPISWSTSQTFFPSYVFTTAIVQNGGHFFDEDFRADWYDNIENRSAISNAIASIKELIDLGYAQVGKAESAALNDFLSNKALFFLGLPWNLNSIIQAYGQQNGNLSEEAVMADRVGGTSLANWFAMNGETENSEKVFGDSHFFAMSNTVTDINKKAAICKFISWFTQEGDVGAAWAEAGHVSASTYILNSESYQSNNIVSNYINSFYSDINQFECSGLTPYYADTFSNLNALFAETIRVETNQVEEIIKSKQDTVNAIVDFFG
jgi:ABC-type glycerol-3-phosphate transport system substrate-binding protein